MGHKRHMKNTSRLIARTGTVLFVAAILLQVTVVPRVIVYGWYSGSYLADLLFHLPTVLGVMCLVGWSLAGATFRPGNSLFLGIVSAASLYTFVGIAYFMIRFSLLSRPEIIGRLDPKFIVFLIIRWPLNIVLDVAG